MDNDIDAQISEMFKSMIGSGEVDAVTLNNMIEYISEHANTSCMYVISVLRNFVRRTPERRFYVSQ